MEKKKYRESFREKVKRNDSMKRKRGIAWGVYIHRTIAGTKKTGKKGGQKKKGKTKQASEGGGMAAGGVFRGRPSWRVIWIV